MINLCPDLKGGQIRLSNNIVGNNSSLLQQIWFLCVGDNLLPKTNVIM